MKGSKQKGRRTTGRRTPAKSPVDLGSVREQKRSENHARPSSIKLKKREFFMLIFFTLAFLFMVYRIGYIQFVKGEEYQKMAYANQTHKRMINPKRGTIYDRNGKGLAISASVDTVSVNPRELRDEIQTKFEKEPNKMNEVAGKLAAYLEMDPAKIIEIFNRISRFEFIKRKIDKELGDEIRVYVGETGLTSIFIDEDSKRYYPNGKLASHILGFTGVDDQGLNGIEMRLDSTLKGIPGKIMNEVDVLGRQIKFSKERYVDAIDGYDVYLTIDETIQHYAEKALDQAMLDYNLKRGAMAIVMNPNTGEILAMASKPDFDPNMPDARPENLDDPDWQGFKSVEDAQLLWQTVFRNKAVMDTYEPGSVFKAITTAAAFEEGVVSLSTPEVCKPYSIAGHTIDCWRRGGHGSEDFLHAVYNSCNPVFVKVGLSLGIQKFYQYVRMFGFMERTNINIAGEPTSEEYRNLWHKDPKEIDLAVSSFGQRFQVSPIQMVCAYSAIANGGNLMEPILVKQIVDSEGNIISKSEPKVVRKVISEETSAQVRQVLEGVVSEGTGKNAYISGYRIAGKTGTSQTLQTDSDGRYIVSFAAIAPADKPQIVVLVALDHPQVAMNLRTGGLLAAPVAGKLCEEILEYLQVERQYTEKDKQQMTQEVYVPDVTGLTLKEAKEKLKAFGLKGIVEPESTDDTLIVQSQTPKPDFSVPQNSTVILYTDKQQVELTTLMPDLMHKTITEATAAMKNAGLNMRIRGEGTVMKQEYPAGTELKKGDVVEVSFMTIIGD